MSLLSNYWQRVVPEMQLVNDSYINLVYRSVSNVMCGC